MFILALEHHVEEASESANVDEICQSNQNTIYQPYETPHNGLVAEIVNTRGVIGIAHPNPRLWLALGPHAVRSLYLKRAKASRHEVLPYKESAGIDMSRNESSYSMTRGNTSEPGDESKSAGEVSERGCSLSCRESGD